MYSISLRTRRGWIFTIGFIALYILLGNARSARPNPFIPGEMIAVNVFIPVVAGLLGGWKMGILVGFFGTMLNTLTPVDSNLEFLLLLPNTVAGLLAGMLRKHFFAATAAICFVVAHILRLGSYLIFDRIELSLLSNPNLWKSIAFQIIFAVVNVMLIIFVFRIGFSTNGNKRTIH
ncbi:MAG: hypothetical protein K8S56_00205 [Candidatus Cloacimonetes bacterium]|nr:hypothetical protein [Candidatus Cloacimonadota bacterium]